MTLLPGNRYYTNVLSGPLPRITGCTAKVPAMTDPGEGIRSSVLIIGDQPIELSPDMSAYLEYEAKRRGISVEDVYKEEVHFRALAERNAPTREELRALARTSKPDPRLLEGDQRYPF